MTIDLTRDELNLLLTGLRLSHRLVNDKLVACVEEGRFREVPDIRAQVLRHERLRDKLILEPGSSEARS
jgi:hypothetical protein